MFFDFLLVLGLVGSDVGNLLPVGPPGKLLNPVRRVGNLPCFAAGHGENENLRLRVFSGSVHGDKRQAVAAGRPARRAYTFALVGQDMLRSRSDLNQDEFAIAPVLVEIWPRDDENDGLPFG